MHRMFLGSAALTLAMAVACGGSSTIEGMGGQGGTGAGSGASGGTGGSGAGTFGACDGPAQCVLVGKTCCGTCGESSVADHNAIHEDESEAYGAQLCVGNVNCPACEGWMGDDLFAYCDAGSCVAADARLHEVSACTDSTECQLRYELGCCPGCGGNNNGFPDPYYGLVAVSAQGALLLGELTCPEDSDIGCPECDPQFPPEAAAVCEQGHCQVIIATP